MQEMKSLVTLDDLDPLERLDALLADQVLQVQRFTEQTLLMLSIIDTALETTLAAKSIYILDSGILQTWLAKVSGEGVEQASYTLGLILLDEADVIFRFTCAKKFGITDKRLKQLRINSWGKAYVNDRDLTVRYPGQVSQLKEICGSTLKSHAGSYNKLVNSLRQPAILSERDGIHVLNQALPLKLLS